MSKTENTLPIPRRSRVPAGFQEYEGDRQFATTLARGLELLHCFTPREPVLGNKELAQRLSLPAATISRLTYTLMCMGYLAQTDSYGKYRLGSAVLSLGYPLLELFTVRRQARPLMFELAAETGGAVSIGIRDRLSIVYIEAIRHSANSVYPLDVGTTHSLAGTAIGRACLMACPPREREALLNQLRVKTPDEWERHGTEVMRNLAQYARWGSCVSVGEVYPDVQAVAVPLGKIDRGETAALNCSFQGKALNESWLREEIAPKLLALARRIA
ncbi:IclR family transcriptional regulator [Polaromonas sp. C04]|uniref:IclR family transcriptional regulator n=1 Tax=Polaromonas sp. C04 TaxID=1945857 RepID=UPI000987BEFE|nr:IclR family transcriptional regulator [Polaromonas sp. C04]